MTDAQKLNDATRYLVVAMLADGFQVVAVCDSEGDARKTSEEKAREQDGVTFGVFQKIGTAVLEHKVAWKGAAG